MNPTFSSPVLTERCKYRWEDLEKAAQGIYTPELKAMQETLTRESAVGHMSEMNEASRMFPYESFSEASFAAPAVQAAQSVTASAVASTSPGFTVPFRDQSGYLVREARESRSANIKRVFFEPPRVTVPSVEPDVQATSVAPVFKPGQVAQSQNTSADEELLMRVAEETARAVTANLTASVDAAVTAALKTVADNLKGELQVAISTAVSQGIREGIAKVQRNS